jgi:hypothetical protein
VKKTKTAIAAGFPSDEEIRERIRERWAAMKLLKVHCGGHGLVVGCPVCGRKFPR